VDLQRSRLGQGRWVSILYHHHHHHFPTLITLGGDGIYFDKYSAIILVIIMMSRVVSCVPFLPWMSKKATKGIIARKPEIDNDQTAMGLPPSTIITIKNSYITLTLYLRRGGETPQIFLRDILPK
jgi:hypothetical protein